MISIARTNISLKLQDKLLAYTELIKLRLTMLVAFSCGFGFVLASNGAVNWANLLAVCFGGFLISGGSIIINQIFERDTDKLMSRTMNRPLPTYRVTVNEAIALSLILSTTGLLILLIVSNVLTVVLSIASLILYAFVYTPLKRVGPVAVFVGAIPGALPPLLGWTAATGAISHEALIIFGIQFIWQFPHFWAIAWLAYDDYKKAGIKLLPSGGEKDINTAIQIMIYTLFLIPLGLLPAKFGVTGIDSAILTTVCGVLFLSQTFLLMKDGSSKAAKRIMYSSFIYLPVVQIGFLLDRIS
ncbi:MAG: heme o synthase [Cyclobacteriaceae bacterium]|nr:heme o synthase [Cyclobacteriaceae bacterium]